MAIECLLFKQTILYFVGKSSKVRLTGLGASNALGENFLCVLLERVLILVALNTSNHYHASTLIKQKVGWIAIFSHAGLKN